MAIKNYTSDKPIERIFAELQHALGTHGAKHISFEYSGDGKIQGVAFTIKVHDRFIPIKLPARVEKAQAVLKKQWEDGMISHKRGRESTYGYEQAYRVAWRNILDWVQALVREFHETAARTEQGLTSNPFARIEGGRLRLRREPRQMEPEGTTALRQLVRRELGRVRIEQLLMEVDGHCGFSRHLVPPMADPFGPPCKGLFFLHVNPQQCACDRFLHVSRTYPV